MAPEQSPKKIGKSVGEKIRAARVALKYTQSQLASPDFSVSYISAIERGQIHPSLRALEIIAARLGLPSTQFLPQRPGEDEVPTTPRKPERDDDEGELILFDTYQLLVSGQGQKMLAQLGKVSARRMRRDLQMHHRYLTASAYYLLGRFTESESLLTTLIDVLKENTYPYIYLHTLDLLGQVRTTLEAGATTPTANTRSALAPLQQCLSLLNNAAVRNSFLLFKVYSHLGIYATQSNDFNTAGEMFSRAVEVSHEFETPQRAQHIYNALYADAHTREDFFVATLYAYHTLYATQRVNAQRQRADLYYALGRTLIEQDSRETADRVATAPVAILDGAGTPSTQSIYEVHDEHEIALQDVYHTLMKMQAREKQVPSPDALTIAALDINIGTWLLAHQRLQEARDCALEALLLAQDAGDTAILANAYFLSGRIDYALQQYDSGNAQFETGIAMLERLHLEDDIAHNALYYAQQLERQGKEREALAYFRRAFQSGQNSR